MKGSLTLRLLNELKAMSAYATDQGHTTSSEVVAFIHFFEEKLQRTDEAVTNEELHQLATYHGHLAQTVAPAKPSSIHLTQQGAQGWLSFLGPVGIVRQLTMLALFFLVCTVALALSPQVNRVTINQGIFDSSGYVLLLNLLFLLCCAGLGATFASLHKLFGYLNSTTYSAKYNATYWLKIMMGLMSGLMLCELLPLGGTAAQEGSSLHDLDKPLAALLGGFSSDLVYRILSRILESVEQMFGKSEPKPAAMRPSPVAPLTQSAALASTPVETTQASEDKKQLSGPEQMAAPTVIKPVEAMDVISEQAKDLKAPEAVEKGHSPSKAQV